MQQERGHAACGSRQSPKGEATNQLNCSLLSPQLPQLTHDACQPEALARPTLAAKFSQLLEQWHAFFFLDCPSLHGCLPLPHLEPQLLLAACWLNEKKNRNYEILVGFCRRRCRCCCLRVTDPSPPPLAKHSPLSICHPSLSFFSVYVCVCVLIQHN